MAAVKSSVFLVFFVAAVAALLLVQAEARSYGVNSLSKSSCRFAQEVDVAVGEFPSLGDDRSPVVVGSSGVYYVGDARTGSFYKNLTLQATTTTRIDGLFSDLGNGDLWTFGTSSSTWLAVALNAAIPEATRLTHLIPLAADAEGQLSTDEGREVVALSSPLFPHQYDIQPTLFLGMGEFVYASSAEGPSEFAGVFLVDIATGTVERIYEMAEGEAWVVNPRGDETENWVTSGVMERSGETIKLLAVYSNWTDDAAYTGGVYRYNVDGSLHSKVYRGFLDDAATFTVNYWSNDDKRWFAHGETAPLNADESPRIPGLTESEWILSCAADHYNASGASTMSCAVCALVSAMWSSFFF
jgi:hypothetical protein